MNIFYDHTRKITPEEFIDLLRRSTLSERRPVDDIVCIDAMLQNADLLCTAWDDDRLVGVGRSVTDFDYCCYLSDLAVDEHYQRMGIGRELIRLTQSLLGPRATIILLSAPMAEEYYPKIGFSPHKSAWTLAPGHGRRKATNIVTRRGRHEIQNMKGSRGSCVCASVRYEIVIEPIALFCCHCTECQTASGASSVLALKVPYGGVSVIEGEARPYLRPEADGQQRNVFRCPKCLAALWSERVDTKEQITVYAGTLDESTTLRPVAHIWTQDAQPWIVLPKDSLQFPRNPPDMQPIVQAWRHQNETKAK